MFARIITENGIKKIQPLTADVGAGAPVGSLAMMYKKSAPSGYLYCDGSTFNATTYPALYAYLGSNTLPDYREFAPVGAEQNTTDTIAAHDVYVQGEGKDDQAQSHTHEATYYKAGAAGTATESFGGVQLSQVYASGYHTGVNGGRSGNVTRGKRKAVYFYIKATSGLAENQQENVLATINENNSYSTTEQPTGAKWIDGKPIYRKVVNYGQLPNNTRTEIAHNITNIENVIKAEIIAKNTEAFIISNYGGNTCSCYVNQTKVSVRTDTDLSSYSGVVVIEYTKNT